MTWLELSEVVDQQIQALFPDEIPALRVLAPDALSATVAFPLAERKYKTGLHKAVVEFARKGRWPRLLPEERLLLYFRLKYGLSVVRILASIQPTGETKFSTTSPDSPNNMEPLLVWLLETVWEDFGREYTFALYSSFCAVPPLAPDLPRN